MGVKSLQASSAHPQWETLQEESSMSEPVLACIAMHNFLLFLSCPPLLHSPEVLPLTDPSYVQGEKTAVVLKRKGDDKSVIPAFSHPDVTFQTLFFIAIL